MRGSGWQMGGLQLLWKGTARPAAEAVTFRSGSSLRTSAPDAAARLSRSAVMNATASRCLPTLVVVGAQRADGRRQPHRPTLLVSRRTSFRESKPPWAAYRRICRPAISKFCAIRALASCLPERRTSVDSRGLPVCSVGARGRVRTTRFLCIATGRPDFLRPDSTARPPHSVTAP